MSEITGKVFDTKVFKRILKYVKPYQSRFIFTGLLTFLLGFLGPARPILVQYTLDNSIITPNPTLLFQLTAAMIGLLVAETVVQFYQTYMANWVGQNVIKDLREETYHKISAFKLKYFDQTPIGTMVTRVVSDIETIADVFSNGVLIIVGDILKLIIVIIIMFVTDWRLALLSLGSIPFLLIATKMFNKAIKSAFQDVRTEVSRLNAFVQEHITGMNIVQIFNREQKEYEKFKGINKKHRNAHIRTVWANAIFFPVVELFSATSLALLVWFGSKGILDESVSFGNLVAFILYIHMLFRPIRQLADRFNTLQMGMVSSERVFKVLDTDAKIENEGNLKLKNPKGQIDFKDVWFAYNEPEWILRDINFSVAPGEKVALVGPTGAGKSSIINLLGRFYEYQKGTVSIDGNLIQDIDLNSLRKHVGIVVQDVFLFSDTIYNNITLNNPRITMEEVRTASKEIGADDFIMRLPGDYQYAVGERGGTLSVGQRQLLAFIRAYLYNPEILILDEATSSVDTESEEMIQKATEKITENRTSIIIAHRLATIQKSDRIMVVDVGRIIESGNHTELLKENGFYKNLYDMQFATELES
ncbi:MAG: antibiotic ABC transporter ATP-binding protein [Crocinitomicaceae bacterium]|nr:antibiotic ABC transporter ATP-binding protein [Crocinitomicaceae bacterium]|tara:strand:+ start:56039 stop:57799 length:1761 start_codon:yes stop_codon:yes gene_type:complete